MNKQLASLLFYNETLYKSPETAEVVAVEVKLPVFTKKILLLLDELTTQERQLLGNIMRAIKVDFAEVESHRQPLTLEVVSAAATVEKVLVFGEFLQGFDARAVTLYAPVPLNGKTFLFADSVKIINLNAAKEKTRLWEALQKMFLTTEKI